MKRAILVLSCFAFLFALCSKVAVAQEKATKEGHIPVLHADKWGLLTAPVYGTHDRGVYGGAELFPGPNKFGTYFAGVLPNGRIVKPAGISVQVGMNPLGVALTPDGKYLITSNDDSANVGFQSYRNPSMNVGGYSLSVIDTASMKVVSTVPSAAATGNSFYIGLQVTGTGPYTLWASGGVDNNVKIFNISTTGAISAGNPASIPIAPITPRNQGFASNYVTAPNTVFPTTPWGFNRNGGTQATWPAGCALSPDGKFLYVVCNTDNSIAVINTQTNPPSVVNQKPVGYLPYAVFLSGDGQTVTVSNWGITEYKFKNPTYDDAGNLTALAPIPGNQPDGFYVPVTSTSGTNPKTSSISILNAPGGDGSMLSPVMSVYQGHALDALNNVGDTHPSATAILDNGALRLLYVTKSNSDKLGVINLGNNNESLGDIDLSPAKVDGITGNALVGAYPNAIVISPDKKRMYVAEAGINSVAVLDTTNPLKPALLGRMPTGWYPAALAISSTGRFLYVANAKGIGEDINPKINTKNLSPSPPSGLASDPDIDSHCIFGSVQKIDLSTVKLGAFNVLANNYSARGSADSTVVPIGRTPSRKIKHVFFILQENKTFDSMLGDEKRLAPYAGVIFNNRDGSEYTDHQFTGVSLNMKLLAKKFSTAVNYYSDSEESEAGHNFATSGTVTDYTEKTLLMDGQRGCLKDGYNPEEYPENGYIFNNAARNGVDFKVFGDPTLINGSDTGSFSVPTVLNDPASGLLGYPLLADNNYDVVNPIQNEGDVDTTTQGQGQSFFLKLPMLAVLGENNAGGEPRMDTNYPGFNLNISDQRRAQEFISDFDRMVSQGTLPHYVHIWLPNSHTGYGGPLQAPNAPQVVTNSPVQQVADSDVALGMVVQHIMNSPVYYDKATGEGSAIFITFDDAQLALDHIHPHRTPLIVVSPYTKPGYVAKKHYSTASVVKTEELLLGLPPNNLGDLFATDLRDLFQPRYNKIRASDVPVTRTASYRPSKEGMRIWSLVKQLDTRGPDRDDSRLGALTRLSMGADDLHRAAKHRRALHSKAYKAEQAKLFEKALKVVSSNADRYDND